MNFMNPAAYNGMRGVAGDSYGQYMPSDAPPCSEMQNIIQEITCALLAFCDWVRRPKPGEHLHFAGKISGLIFDHFGDFEGFIFATMHGQEHRFHSREKDVAMLAERVWRERLRITATTEHHEPHRPLTIIIHEPPVPF